MTSEFAHTSVLLHESIAALQPRSGGRYIDATLGAGGHAEKILDLSRPDGTLLGIDADPAAIAATWLRLAEFHDRFVAMESYYDRLAELTEGTDFDRVDGILFDLGTSSPQLDQGERGFSFQQDAPLDMRFGPGAARTAADIVNSLSATELQHLFQEFGEERHARRVALRIVEARRTAPIYTTAALATIVRQAKPPSDRDRIHPATRVFQALRIAVNDELTRLQHALPEAAKLLVHGGRIAVISFHSLEDRVVKQFMRLEARDCVCPPAVPVCVCGHRASLRILTRRPIEASAREVASNPRARSAKLRIAEKIT